MTHEYRYTGTQILENLGDAKNYNAKLVSLLRRAYHLTPQTRILDFGAGVGTFARILRDEGFTVECVEIDADESEKLQAAGFTVYRSMDEVQDGAYDFIYTLNVLEHIEDHVGVLRALRAKLKKGGVLFAFVPAFPMLYSSFDTLVGHVRRYRKASLKAALEAAEFRISRLAYFDAIGFFAALVFRILQSQPSDVTKGKIAFFDKVAFPLNVLADPILCPFFGKNVYAVAEAE